MSMSESESLEVKTHVSPRIVDPRLLELRRQIKDRTPDFKRQESWRYVRIHEPWRKPKGVDSHMRLSVKGWPALVKIGYRVPKSVRGLHPSGFRDILVHNMSELEALNRETDAARLSAGLGRKKRIEIATRARGLGIRVLNARGLIERAPGVEEKAEKKKEPEAKKPGRRKAKKSPKAKPRKAKPKKRPPAKKQSKGKDKKSKKREKDR
jgi:large subunit ribosomal protein L32e